ncbi:MAG: 1-acyl-sn-glycerol-3-phosphate acyltransferase [Paludibacter sp.]|nr:1-acyl-sn-glycerol-3-phosphate acyltransferase [Paludibacter sp.]
MKKIYDYQNAYILVRNYFVFSFKRFYGEYVVNGRENIPAEGPVIYAANHLNALMDALAVISILPRKRSIVYLVRSDYFKNKIAAKILCFLKLIPVFRMRDGMENLEKNQEIFEQCVDVLEHNIALGIMPEGNQGPYKKIRPLVKGIFRIAFAAQQKNNTPQGVKILPIGIDFGDLEKFGKHVIVNIGKPIEVSEYMEEYIKSPVSAINQLRERLKNALTALTLHIDTKTHYDCFETATEVASTAFTENQGVPRNTLLRFFTRQNTAKELDKLEKNNPEITEKLEVLCAEYNENLKKLNLQSWVFGKKYYNNTVLFINGLLLTGFFPVFLIGFILNVIPFFLPDIIRKIYKLKIPGGLSSFRVVIGMLSFPISYFAQGIAIYKKLNGDFWNLLFIIPLQYIFGKLAFKWYESFKKVLAKIRYRKLQLQNSPLLNRTQFLREEIIQILQAS